MNKKLLLPLFILLTGCALVTEPDISDSEVFLISPVHNLTTETATHTFWWEHVLDATNYNLIIVSPKWDSVISLVADTNLSSNKFVMTLPPGQYEWGVSANNYSSATSYTVNSLIIEATSDLTNQTMSLLKPTRDKATNEKTILFQWGTFEQADQYILDIKYDSWEGENAINTKTTSYDTAYIPLLEGKYVWGVQAKNDFSNTPYTKRNLTVDFTAPETPTITLPNRHGDTLSVDDLRISWDRNGSSLSAMSDSIFISTDSLNINNTEDIYPTSGTEINLNLDDYPAGKYYLKVLPFDAAGNVGEPTTIKKFYIVE